MSAWRPFLGVFTVLFSRSKALPRESRPGSQTTSAEAELVEWVHQGCPGMLGHSGPKGQFRGHLAVSGRVGARRPLAQGCWLRFDLRCFPGPSFLFASWMPRTENSGQSWMAPSPSPVEMHEFLREEQPVKGHRAPQELAGCGGGGSTELCIPRDTSTWNRSCQLLGCQRTNRRAGWAELCRPHLSRMGEKSSQAQDLAYLQPRDCGLDPQPPEPLHPLQGCWHEPWLLSGVSTLREAEGYHVPTGLVPASSRRWFLWTPTQGVELAAEQGSDLPAL